MMLIRAAMYCLGFPDGNISHGHVDVRVQGDDQDSAQETLLGQLDRWCCLEEKVSFVDFFLLDQKEDNFDRGDVYATVAGGGGDALARNPAGKVFSDC